MKCQCFIMDLEAETKVFRDPVRFHLSCFFPWYRIRGVRFYGERIRISEIKILNKI